MQRLLVTIAYFITLSLSATLPVIDILPTADFIVTGDGSSEEWCAVDWINVPQRRTKEKTSSLQIKVLYSATGIYALFQCEDTQLTATFTEDFSDLWKEDVVEWFIWPETSVPIYFEYELSPLNVELPILVPNINGKRKGWLPWQYTGNRKIIHQTSAVGGNRQSMASVTAWIAECYIPYAVLYPIVTAPPQPGDTWRMNFYRLDHDTGQRDSWEWAPVNDDFHDYQHFGIAQFR